MKEKDFDWRTSAAATEVLQIESADTNVKTKSEIVDQKQDVGETNNCQSKLMERLLGTEEV